MACFGVFGEINLRPTGAKHVEAACRRMLPQADQGEALSQAAGSNLVGRATKRKYPTGVLPFCVGLILELVL